MGRDCKAMEAIDMNRKDREVKDMRQVHLTPLSAVVDEVWGEKGSPRRDAMEKQLKDEVNSYRLGAACARLAWLKTSLRTNWVGVLACSVLRFAVWRADEGL